jgi:AraC-like DNA-binding protein
LFTPVVANAFAQLSISVALWITDDFWYPIHGSHGVLGFEYSFDKTATRFDYNRENFARVTATKKSWVGSHAGFADLFVPALRDSQVQGVFVAGPFATSRPTSGEIQRHWSALSGSPGRVTDPEFADYVDATLATLRLEGPLLPAFERLMTCFVGLTTGQGSPEALASQAHAERDFLLRARFPERAWNETASMVDERSVRVWKSTATAAETLGLLGLEQVPQHVVVCLVAETETERLDERLRRYMLSRELVDFARKLGNVACGRIEHSGVFFLVNDAGPASRLKSKLTELATRVSSLARAAKLRVHVGVRQALDSESLPSSYQAAIAAAERALAEDRSLIFAEHKGARSTFRLRELRMDFSGTRRQKAGTLPARFEHYIQAVLDQTRYRLETARIELDAGFEHLVEPLLRNGTLDRRSFEELCRVLERTARTAQNVNQLAAGYRRLVSDLERAISAPTEARRERGTRRALAYIREHLAEPLTLGRVARVAGFAPSHFCRVFQRAQGVRFSEHLQQLRLERARELLDNTSLSVEQIQELSGFGSRTYFHRVFRRSVGVTPAEYRGA